MANGKSKLRLVAVVLVMSAMAFALYLWSSHRSAEHALAMRDTSFREIQSRFQQDLPLGLPRSRVYEYLRSRNVKFYDSDRYFGPASVPAGTDPLDFWHFPCYAREVFVVFDFNGLPKQQAPSALDNLRDIRIEQMCDK